MAPVISLELNELNFDLVERYAKDLKLSNFERLLGDNLRFNTIAESEFVNVEPWIQWVTVHTGLDFAEHQIFRLGDVVDTEYVQIWEKLEKDFGATVGAVSPMNARQSTQRAAFFVPDPWTGTDVRGSWDIRALYSAIRDAVNSNAEGKVRVRSLINLAAGAAFNVRRSSIRDYWKLVRQSRGRKWIKAGVLDYLLTDTFVTQWTKHKPQYSTLFLNAAAHVQHHYMFSSPYYVGPHRNPEWYVAEGLDPLADIYRIYDDVLGHIFKLVDSHGVRLLVMTGLSQVANSEITFYYRPKNHASLVQQLGIPQVVSVEPRMSRDFLVEFSSESAAREGERRFESITTIDGDRIFTADNRGKSLFVKVAYTHEMADELEALVDGKPFPRFGNQFVHVSIENSVHTKIGTLIDCGERADDTVKSIPLAEVFKYTYTTVQDQCA